MDCVDRLKKGQARRRELRMWRENCTNEGRLEFSNLKQKSNEDTICDILESSPQSWPILVADGHLEGL